MCHLRYEIQVACWNLVFFSSLLTLKKTLIANSNDWWLKNTEWGTFLICLGLIYGLAAAVCEAAEGTSLVYSCVLEKFLLLAGTRASGIWL